MSERINKFCTSLEHHLNALEARAISLKASLQAASGHAEDTLREKLDQAEKKVQSQKQAVARARTSVQIWFEQKKTEAQATIDEAEHAVLEAIAARLDADAVTVV